MEHLRVIRVAVRNHDPDLATDRLHGIGFKAVNDDGWEGPLRPIRQDAVRDVIDRRNEQASRAAEPEDAQATGRADSF